MPYFFYKNTNKRHNTLNLTLVHKGKFPVALVEIRHKITDQAQINGTSFGHDYRVKILSWYKDVKGNKGLFEKPFTVGYNATFQHLQNETKETLITIKRWYNYINSGEVMKEKIELLKYKKQIILQGPPGTGKTRMAKMMAQSLVGTTKDFSPLQLVEKYIREYKVIPLDRRTEEEHAQLLKEFQEEFPVDKLKDLSLNDYAMGNESADSFCYWIEKKLSDLGTFSPGQAGTTVYLISYKSEGGLRLPDEKKDVNELMKEISDALVDLAQNQDIEKARDLEYWYSFILKVLSSYYPADYFPVYSKELLKKVAKILEIDTKGKNDVLINQEINNKYKELKKKYTSDISSFKLMRYLYTAFDLKNNKDIPTLMPGSSAEFSDYTLIQFHPSFTYEDFVRGIVVETTVEGTPEYKVQNKILAELAEKAYEDSNQNFVLIIDEINRANLSSVLGELIYALEYRYNFKADNYKEAVVESMYALKSADGTESRELVLPENLYIIGTMNTADRSVGHIDYAIRRRFAFEKVPPDLDPVHSLVEELFKQVSELFVKDLDDSEYSRSDSLMPDFDPEDVWIGHSYFIAKDDDGVDLPTDEAEKILAMKMKFEVLPLVEEYVKDGILKAKDDRVKEVLDALRNYGV